MATAAAINERSALAVEFYSGGMSAEAIAVRLGVDADTVRRDLRRLGVPTRRRGPTTGSPKIVFSVSEVVNRRARVRELAGLGKGDVEIARALGVSKTTIAADRRALGIAPRPPGSRRSTLSLNRDPARRAVSRLRPREGRESMGKAASVRRSACPWTRSGAKPLAASSAR